MPKMPRKRTMVDDNRILKMGAFAKPKAFTDLRDFTDTPKALEDAIDRGDMDALVTLYKLKDGHLGMMNGGFTPEALFAVICELRRMMIATHGMVDEDEAARAAVAGARP